MPRESVLYRPSRSPAGGRVEVNPAFAAGFSALGIDTAAGFLDLQGEVVSGHPDRHVVRVELPGFPNAFYLKRQHSVNWRERLRNRRAGFGWVSRCEREAALLTQLAAAGLPAPRWAAVGADARGRAFLLVEELSECVDLRRVPSVGALSLGTRLGRLIARFHAAGFTTPDLTAKHVLVSRKTGEITLIDWQAARRVRNVPPADRLRALAALHASLADELATPRERLRVLRAALGPARRAGSVRDRFSRLARRVGAEAKLLSARRSIRDQRQPAAGNQRLVWLAGEAVCAVPEVAAIWPSPAIAAPFYGCEPGIVTIGLADGRKAQLIRGRSFAPLARFAARLRGRPWRSRGVTLGRILFHLERYGIPAPRLLAFGQHLTSATSAEWFALHTPPAGAIGDPSNAVAEQLGRLLRKLHDAGCRPAGDPLAAFGADDAGVCVRDVTAIRLVRRLTDRDRASDLRQLLAVVGAAAAAGYQPPEAERPTNRLLPLSVSR